MGTVLSRLGTQPLERMVAVKLMRKEFALGPNCAGKFLIAKRAPGAGSITPTSSTFYAFDEWEGQQYLRDGTGRPRQPGRRIEKLRLLSEIGHARHRHQNRLGAGHGAQIRICSTATSSGQHFVQMRITNRNWWNFLALARKAGCGTQVEDVTWGTPYYVAPEKIKRGEAGDFSIGHVQPGSHALSRNDRARAV